MIDSNIVEVCRAYAELVCAARKLHTTWVRSPTGNDYSHGLCGAARELYACAPVDAMPYLDTVKRVLEIDTQTTTVSTVLLRASLITEDPKRWVMRADAPSDPNTGSDLLRSYACLRCGTISYHPRDMIEGYCAACHDFTRREDAP
jgi:hypothetical protein